MEQDAGDDDQRQGQAYPHAVDAPLEDEAEDEAEWQAEDPVADKVATMGARVSPRPRRAPVQMVWTPSKTWKAAAIQSRLGPTARTRGSRV
jgi:hypothetical protein